MTKLFSNWSEMRNSHLVLNKELTYFVILCGMNLYSF